MSIRQQDGTEELLDALKVGISLEMVERALEAASGDRGRYIEPKGVVRAMGTAFSSIERIQEVVNKKLNELANAGQIERALGQVGTMFRPCQPGTQGDTFIKVRGKTLVNLPGGDHVSARNLAMAACRILEEARDRAFADEDEDFSVVCNKAQRYIENTGSLPCTDDDEDINPYWAAGEAARLLRLASDIAADDNAVVFAECAESAAVTVEKFVKAAEDNDDPAKEESYTHAAGRVMRTLWTVRHLAIRQGDIPFARTVEVLRGQLEQAIKDAHNTGS